ncbi:MAG: cell division protein FtsA [Pseudomonadota bacterium]
MTRLTSLLSSQASATQKPVGLLDVGTSKIICMIIARDEAMRPQVLGLGHQRARGIKAGVIVDIDEAELATRAAISQAERVAGVQLETINIAVACGRLKSSAFLAHADVEGRVVRDEDVERVMVGGRHFAERDGRILVHMNACAQSLDGTDGIPDARGLAGRILGLELHTVTADEGPLRNLIALVERCDLTVSGLIVSAFASGLATLTRDERLRGAACVDIGGGSTGIALFADDHFLHVDGVSVGGNHLTFDIARALGTPVGDAERIKTLYANLAAAASDERETISYPLAARAHDTHDGAQELDDGHFITRAQLRDIIRPRVADLMGMIGERIARADIGLAPNAPVVLTGGAAQMVGLGPCAAEALQRPVRVARPNMAVGMPDSVCSATLSTVAGMAHALADPAIAIMTHTQRDTLGTGTGSFGRVGQWLRGGF